MNMMEPRTYQSITEEHWAAIVTEADKALVIKLSCYMGSATAYHVKVGYDIFPTSGHVPNSTITWNYNPTTLALILQCTDKPWYVSESLVDDKLDALVRNTQ